MRAPFNVLVIPFLRESRETVLYCPLLRADAGYWQWVAGGGEDEETPVAAAIREVREETGLSGQLFRLDTRADVPKTAFHPAHLSWPEEIYVVPQHMFALEATSLDVHLSHEHTEYRWVSYEAAYEMLHWQSNQVALWELSQRIPRSDLKPADVTLSIEKGKP